MDTCLVITADKVSIGLKHVAVAVYRAVFGVALLLNTDLTPSGIPALKGRIQQQVAEVGLQIILNGLADNLLPLLVADTCEQSPGLGVQEERGLLVCPLTEGNAMVINTGDITVGIPAVGIYDIRQLA